jgi:hypothetical protein
MISFDLAEGKKEELKKRIQKNEAACFYPMSMVSLIAIGLWQISRVQNQKSILSFMVKRKSYVSGIKMIK